MEILPGELALLCLAGLTGLVRVPGEDHGIHVLGEGVLDEMVEGVEEILHAAGPAALGQGASVALDPDVQVGEVDYSH